MKLRSSVRFCINTEVNKLSKMQIFHAELGIPLPEGSDKKRITNDKGHLILIL